MTFKRIALALVLMGFVCAVPSFAQATKPKSWYGYVQGGWSGMQGEADDILDGGWNLTGGATWWPTSAPVGLQLEVSYNTYDLKSSVARRLEADGGDLDIWTIGANVQWAVPTDSMVGFYLMGGISADYLRGRLTDTVGVIVCDPYYWWWCYPTTGTNVKASESTWEFGYQAGLGLSFKLSGGTLLYLEARYHWVDLETPGGASTSFVPVMFGARF